MAGAMRHQAEGQQQQVIVEMEKKNERVFQVNTIKQCMEKEGEAFINTTVSGEEYNNTAVLTTSLPGHERTKEPDNASLGHHLTDGKKLKAARPTTKKSMKAFLKVASYYEKFIPNYAEVVAPLTEAARRGKPGQVQWDSACEKAFNKLKVGLYSKPVSDPEEIRIWRTDALQVPKEG